MVAKNQTVRKRAVEPSPELFKSLLQRLQEHDWTWAYADEYLRDAAKNERGLQRELATKRCPYTWEQLYSFVAGWTFDAFEETEPDKWFRKTTTDRRYTAPLETRRLISVETYDAIDTWLFLNCRFEV